MHRKIITLLIIGVVALTATAVFAADDYNSSRSNTSTAIVGEQVGDILLRYDIGGAQINKITDSLVVGVSKVDLKATLIEIGIGDEGVNEIFIKLDELEIGVDSSIVSPSTVIDAKPISPTDTIIQQRPVSTSTPIEVKPIAVCYIPDKLTKDYSRLLLDLRKAELEGDKETAGEIIKKIIALKLEIERYRKECVANAPQLSPMQLPTEVIRPLAPTIIDRCREVEQWENKITYYEKLNNLSNADLKEQTGFSKEEIENILVNLPVGLEKVRVQCQMQGERTIGAGQVAEIVKRTVTVGQISIAEPIKPVVVESGQEIDDYYKARIERITATENTEEQIQNLKLLKGEIDELIAKLIKGRKEIEISELSNVVMEIKVSRGKIKADDVVINTTDKKIFFTVGGKPASVEPTSKGVIVRGWDSNGKNVIEVKAEEISIKDEMLRVGNSEVKLAAMDVIESISKRSGRAKYANITLEKGIVLKEENGRAVYKIKETEPRKLFGFIPIRITKTLTASAETSDLLDERFPWYAFLTTK